MNYAETLTQLIDGCGLTKADIARELNMTHQAVSKKFRKNQFTYKDIETILNLCGATIEIVTKDGKRLSL